MASYTVTSPASAAHAKTLVANTVDTVTIDRALDHVEVTTHDVNSPVYFTTDGSTPTVGGASTFVIPAVIATRTERAFPARPSGGGSRSTVVKLISAGTTTYSVAAVEALL